MQPTLPVFVFDGDCGFCRKWVVWLQRRLPANTRFVPYQEIDDLRAYGLTVSDLTTASYWITAEGAPHRGARSFAHALQTGRLPWSALGIALSTPPIDAIADRIYPVIARNRHRLPAPDLAPPSRDGGAAPSRRSGTRPEELFGRYRRSCLARH